MFVWFSSENGRSNIGCCGGGLLLLPLTFLTVFGGFGDSGLLILIVAAVLFAIFVLPGITGRVQGEKQKNDQFDDGYDEKPKRGEARYELADDGEIIEVIDEKKRAR